MSGDGAAVSRPAPRRGEPRTGRPAAVSPGPVGILVEMRVLRYRANCVFVMSPGFVGRGIRTRDGRWIGRPAGGRRKERNPERGPAAGRAFVRLSLRPRASCILRETVVGYACLALPGPGRRRRLEATERGSFSHREQRRRIRYPGMRYGQRNGCGKSPACIDTAWIVQYTCQRTFHIAGCYVDRPRLEAAS